MFGVSYPLAAQRARRVAGGACLPGPAQGRAGAPDDVRHAPLAAVPAPLACHPGRSNICSNL
ncbi:hypothetical protein ACU4GD_44725 [Cupriavidus basilensis]